MAYGSETAFASSIATGAAADAIDEDDTTCFTTNSESTPFLVVAIPRPMIITDVVMPRVEGFDLLRWVKLNQPNTKVIVLTGFARRHSISDFLLYGADDYLSKPFLVPELLAAVHRAVGSAGPSSGSAADPLAVG